MKATDGMRRYGVAGLLVGIAVSTASPAGAQRDVAANEKPSAAAAARADELLNRPVTLDLVGVSRARAIDAAAARARVLVQYWGKAVEAYRDPVTVRVKGVPLRDVLGRILAGTSLEVVVDGAGQVGIVDRRGSAPGAVQGTGVIVGQVVDSATGKGMGKVSVTVGGTQGRATTNEAGRFVLANLPAGEYVVMAKLIGYRAATRPVTVVAGDTARVRLAMAPAATMLSDVVTTATGVQRRLEVGNDVTTIDVDQVRRTAPVSTVTDVLEGRVPDLVVTRSSGAPGSPSRVRIRGVGSLNGNNDPIVIIDGVRKYSNQTGNARDRQFSVLDNVDLNSVEKIDVLKGPSASALYGSDAANGVIVITTKRGTAGPPRWTFSTDQTRTTQPKDFPELASLEGTSLSGGYPQQCSLGGQPPCTNLHVVRDHRLTDPRTTVLGTGRRQQYNASVAGGSPAVQYFLSGQTSSELGLLKMSDADVAYLERVTGAAVPAWQRRPEGSDQTGGTATLSLAPYQSLAIAVTSSLDRTHRRDTPLSSAFGYLQSGKRPTDTVLVTTPNFLTFREQTKWNELAARHTLTADWTPRAWWSGHGDVGVEQLTREQTQLLRRGDCTACGDETGFYVASNDVRTTGTVNLRTALQLPAVGGIRLTPTAGLNYVRSTKRYTDLNARDLPLGGMVNGAKYVTASDTSATPRQAGVYLETNVSLFDQLYWSVGTRVDGSNALGKRVTPTYPKLSFSYVVPVDRLRVPAAVSALRLRTAYGHAAVQPELGAATRAYVGATGAGEDGVAGPVVDLATLGNPALKPERSTEFEGGVDLTLIGSRVTVTATGYRKLSRDALIAVPSAPSLGGVPVLAQAGGALSVTNLGSVRNAGGDVSVDAKVLDRAAVTWDVQAYYARNTNTLVKLAPSFNQRFREDGTFIGAGIGTRNVVGYPVNGVWLRPVVSYADANGDGAISASELVRSDSAVFVGGPAPKYDAAFATTLGFWGGRITVAANATYQNGAGQVNQALLSNITGGGAPTVAAVSDPATPLVEQAVYRSGYALVHAVNTFRLQSLSVGALLPDRYAQRFFRASSLRVKLEGSNLGLWTTYSGADPNVGNVIGDVVGDAGVLPLPRSWGVNVTLTY